MILLPLQNTDMQSLQIAYEDPKIGLWRKNYALKPVFPVRFSMSDNVVRPQNYAYDAFPDRRKVFFFKKITCHRISLH